MSFIARLQRAREILEQQGRLSTRALERELEIGGDELDELIEELVDVQQVARREGKILVWLAGTERQTPPIPSSFRTDKPPHSSSPGPVDQAEARKVVTIIFADLARSTALHERLDPESVRRFMETYYRAMRGVVEAHGGTVVKLLGDGVMAAFGVPRVAEDDAIRAVRAGVAMQHAFHELAGTLTPGPSLKVGEGKPAVPPLPFFERGLGGEGLGLRVGINTGEVVVSADNTDVVGDPVNVAARLQQEAHDGEVVIGESTRRLVAALVTLVPLGSVALKGRAETMKAYRVESLDGPVATTTAAFVGRDEELARIAAVYEAAVAKPAARLAVLLGSPGLGKSRMIDEFARRLGDTATVLTAQCDAEGGATFAPLAEALREVLRVSGGCCSDEVPGVGAVREPPEPAPRIGTAAWGDSRIAPTSGQQPQRSDQPVATGTARGTAPGGGGAAEDLRAALEAAVPGTDTERARIIDGITALLAGSPASPEETFFVIRRLLAALASVKPVVLVIDDLHWAEPLLLDLVEHLVQWGSGVPLLVLVGARPELRDTRSSLATSGGFVTDVVTLGGLDAGAAMRLAANVIGAADLPAAVAAKVLATSEGNPLFVAELVRMLVQEGALRQEGDRWITGVGLATLEMPPTIHALLAARIERLRPEDRTVLERAAVVGRHFSRSAVSALLPREVTDLDARLEALRRGELIEPDTGWFLGEPVLRFHHILIRDAAYRRLLKGTRVELHERVANWIEARAPDSVEHDETLGWHLEQAHQFLGELGPIDAPGRALGERAARHLGAAGRRALARDDLPVAAGLLGRALDRLDADDPSRAELALDWCEALLAVGDVGTATKAIDELGRFIGEAGRAPSPAHPLSVGEGRGEGTSGGGAGGTPAPGSLTLPSPALNRRAGEASERLHAWHTCFTGQLTVMTAPQAVQATADAVAAAAAALTALGDAAGEAKAHFVHAQVFRRLGKVGACEAALDRALAAARRANDRRRANTVLAIAPLAALWGPSPVTRASGRCLDVVRVLRITQGAPAVEAVALSCQAVLEALRGRTDAARRMIAASRKMVEDLGITQRLLEVDVFGGLIDLLEGDAAAAERSLRGAYEGLRDLGLAIDAARAAALLARALLAQGRVADAEALSHESEALAGDDLKAAIAWRGVRAEALAQRGEHAAAVEFASTAVEIAAATDALLDHADARLALAAALRAAGRGAAADAEERRAIELWETKGATLLVERAHQNVQRADVVRARLDAREAEPPGEPAGGPNRGAGTVRPFDVAQGSGQAAPRVRRRVQENAATAHAVRVVAAVAARDAAALAALLADDMETVHHPTGAAFGKQGNLASVGALFESRDLTFGLEPVATLGDSLALWRHLVTASGATQIADSGAMENEQFVLGETDDQGRTRRTEFFATDHLGDALARLYERYAELLPEGPERTCAAATARSVAAMTGVLGHDRMASAVAPGIEVVDRRILGTWSAHGADALLKHIDAWLEVGSAHHGREEDILGLRSDALLFRRTFSGTDREGGGAFDGELIVLWVFGSDGKMTRWEMFEADGEAGAVARFDELAGAREGESLGGRGSSRASGRRAEGEDGSAGASPSRPAERLGLRRRARPNTGSASMVRIDAAIAARDLDAVAAEIGESFEEISHPTGTTYGREAMLVSLERFLRLPGAKTRHELLGTLGDTLWLFRRWMSASAAGRGRFDVGEYEKEEIGVNEVDAHGIAVRNEIFAANHLGDAVARLYERYAELLPEGAARTRAAAMAVRIDRSDLTDIARALDPAIEMVDHRLVGVGTIRGVEAVVRAVRSLREASEELQRRTDDILALGDEAILRCVTNFGRLRDGGGTFERRICALHRYGPDGRITHWEVFDADRAAEALARFDALTGDGETDAPPERFANSAARVNQTLVRCFNSRDWAGIEACAAPSIVFDDRRRMIRLAITAQDFLQQLRFLFDVPAGRFTTRLAATRGERLALHRTNFEGEVADGGPLELGEHLDLVEIDRDGRIVVNVVFDLDDLDAAYAELDARYDAGEGAVYPAHGAFMRAYARAIASRDWDPVVALCAPTLVEYDHRGLAVLGTTRGAEAWVQNFRTLTDLTSDTVYRVDHFRSAACGFWSVGTWHGSREGGAYEIPINAVLEMDEGDRLARADIYDPDHLDQARARFDELTDDGSALPLGPSILPGSNVSGVGAVREPPDPARRIGTAARGASRSAPTLGHEGAEHTVSFANAATRAVDRGSAALAARDLEGFGALMAPGFRHYDRTRIAQVETDGREWLASFRQMVEMTTAPPTRQVLATRGERLALFRVIWRGAEGDIGPSEIEWVLIIEVDGRGDHVAAVTFDPYDLDAAYAEIDARFDAGEGAAHGDASAWARAFRRLFENRDWDSLAALCAPALVAHDHRLAGWGTQRGPAAWVQALRSLVDLAPDVRTRVNHVRMSDRGFLTEAVQWGTRDGGAFEIPVIAVFELGELGKLHRLDLYDPGQLDQARARFDAIGASRAPDPLRIPPNASTRANDRWWAYAEAEDWDAVRALTAGMVFEDRRRLIRIAGGSELLLADTRHLWDSGWRPTRTLLATAGDRLSLERMLWSLGDGGQVSEIEVLKVAEVDAEGCIVAYNIFDPDDRAAASAELVERYARSGADEMPAAWFEFVRAWNDHDLGRLRTLLPGDYFHHDHRRTGIGRVESEAYIASLAALYELSPDVRLEPLYWVAGAAHARVSVIRWVGTNAEGGEFEAVFAGLSLYRGERLVGAELFEIADLDATLARFEELRVQLQPEGDR